MSQFNGHIDAMTAEKSVRVDSYWFNVTQYYLN